MPRIAKEKKADDEKKTIAKKAVSKKTDTIKNNTKVSSSKKSSTVAQKSSPAKKTKTSKAVTKSSKSEGTSKSKATTRKKASSKNTTTTKSVQKKKTTAKTSTATKKSKTAFPEQFSSIEYYDLPINYEQTIVKLLAQTPTTLFVYWNVSDADKQKYIKQYGENFFEVTKPVLVVYNETKNYSFEVDINDFANCWYLNTNDSLCNYRIELIRKPIEHLVFGNSHYINTQKIYISSSNNIESPNNHILFDKNQNTVFLKNVKTGKITKKFINLSYMTNIGRIYNIYDMYKQMYKDEDFETLSNPSSNSSSSSSTFK